MKYLNAHKDILFSGRKLTHDRFVYWKEDNKVYRHTVDAEMNGSTGKELFALVAFDGTLKRIGNRLKTLREESGLTVQQLSDKTGISKITLNAYEQGKRPLISASALVVYKLARFFGVPMEYLIEEFVTGNQL